MRLLIFSDIHGDTRALERLMDIQADYYFAAGDLVSWGRNIDRTGPVFQRRAGQVYVMPGNHETEADVERLCSRFGLSNFHCRSLEIAGHWIAGLGYSNRTPFHTPGEYSEQELAARLEPFAHLKPLVLVAHCPPKATALDRIGDGVYGGSTAVREFIEQHQPRYFFCGHIHEAEGVAIQMGTTYAVNVGKKGFLLEL